MNKLFLHKPTLEELYYREKILSDPYTMDYNKGYNLDGDDYDNETGCIKFSVEKWSDWYNWFVLGEPERFYAYIVSKKDNTFIGEVNLHKNIQNNWYDVGIVIEEKYQGNKYASEALNLLLKQAFDVFDADAVHNDFEYSRKAAVKAHLNAGFSIVGEHNDICDLLITKSDYYKKLKNK